MKKDGEIYFEYYFKKMEATLKTQQIYAFSIAALACLVSAAVLVRFEKRISRLIRSYEQGIAAYTASLIAEKEKTETAMAEDQTTQGASAHLQPLQESPGRQRILDFPGVLHRKPLPGLLQPQHVPLLFR